MQTKTLPNRFFNDNPLDKMSAAALADFTLAVDLGEDPTAAEEIQKRMLPMLPQARRDDIARFEEEIKGLQSAQEIVSYLRKELELPNRTSLRRVTLAKQEETAPLILKRYLTSGQDHFIENAMAILSRANREYAEQLLRDYGSIRNPYAQSMACLVFGEQKMKEAEPLLLREYERFKKEYPDESYNQGPLLALYILYGRA